MNVHLRPNRSAIRPPSSSRLPKDSAYAVMIHWRSLVGEAEVLLGGGERDVDDRHVEHDQQLGDADDGEDQPPAVVMGIGDMGRTSAMWRAGLRLRYHKRRCNLHSLG